MDSNLTLSLLRLLDCFFTPFIPKEVWSVVCNFCFLHYSYYMNHQISPIVIHPLVIITKLLPTPFIPKEVVRSLVCVIIIFAFCIIFIMKNYYFPHCCLWNDTSTSYSIYHQIVTQNVFIHPIVFINHQFVTQNIFIHPIVFITELLPKCFQIGFIDKSVIQLLPSNSPSWVFIFHIISFMRIF